MKLPHYNKRKMISSPATLALPSEGLEHPSRFTWTNLNGWTWLGTELELRARPTGEKWNDEFITCSYLLWESVRMKLIGVISSSHNMFAQQNKSKRRNNHLVIKPSLGLDKLESEIVKWKWARGKMSPSTGQVCLGKPYKSKYMRWGILLLKCEKSPLARKWICNLVLVT